MSSARQRDLFADPFADGERRGASAGPADPGRRHRGSIDPRAAWSPDVGGRHAHHPRADDLGIRGLGDGPLRSLLNTGLYAATYLGIGLARDDTDRDD